MKEIITVRLQGSNSQLVLTTEDLKQYFESETRPVYLVHIKQNDFNSIYLQETATLQPMLRYFPETDVWEMGVSVPFDFQSIEKFSEFSMVNAYVSGQRTVESRHSNKWESINWKPFSHLYGKDNYYPSALN